MKMFNWLITILLALSLPACDAGTTDNTQEAATTAAKNQQLEGEQSFEEEYEDENGYEPVSKAALEEEFEQEEVAVAPATWQPPVNDRQPPADIPEMIERATYYVNQLNQNTRSSGMLTIADAPVPGYQDLKVNLVNNVVTYSYWCDIDSSNYRAPQQCGTVGSDGRFQPKVTDRQVAESIGYLRNKFIADQQGKLRCTQYVCIDENNALKGAMQPQMWQWMTQNCNIFSDGTYSC